MCMNSPLHSHGGLERIHFLTIKCWRKNRRKANRKRDSSVPDSWGSSRASKHAQNASQTAENGFSCRKWTQMRFGKAFNPVFLCFLLGCGVFFSGGCLGFQGPKRAQNAPKMAFWGQKWPKIAQNGPKMPPKRPKTADFQPMAQRGMPVRTIAPFAPLALKDRRMAALGFGPELGGSASWCETVRLRARKRPGGSPPGRSGGCRLTSCWPG